MKMLKEKEQKKGEKSSSLNRFTAIDLNKRNGKAIFEEKILIDLNSAGEKILKNESKYPTAMNNKQEIIV